MLDDTDELADRMAVGENQERMSESRQDLEEPAKMSARRANPFRRARFRRLSPAAREPSAS